MLSILKKIFKKTQKFYSINVKMILLLQINKAFVTQNGKATQFTIQNHSIKKFRINNPFQILIKPKKSHKPTWKFFQKLTIFVLHISDSHNELQIRTPEISKN